MQTPSSSIKHSNSTRTTLPATRKSRSKQHKSLLHICDPQNRPKRTALARLHTLQRHTDLASGFAVASADLELRGSGNLLGKEQSGHIQVVGLDIYIELLEQCVQELQGKDALTSFDPEVEIPISASIPESYIPETEDRLREYQKLSSTQTHGELRELAERWISAYGELPEQATHLIWNTECQIWCRVLGILKLHWLKSRVLLMLHPHHALDPQKLDRLYAKFPTRITQKKVDTRIEIYATFQKEEAQTPFGFLFLAIPRASDVYDQTHPLNRLQ